MHWLYRPPFSVGVWAPLDSDDFQEQGRNVRAFFYTTKLVQSGKVGGDFLHEVHVNAV